MKAANCLPLVVIALCWIAAVNGEAQEKPVTFRAGAAAIDITPEKLPVSMTGSFQVRLATGVQDRLHARAVVLDDGVTRTAIVVCDSCLISREIYDVAKKIAADATGIPESRMMMAATHTHTAPTAVPLAQVLPDPDYPEFLAKRIAEAVIEANAKLQTARIGWGVGEEPGEVGNRRWFVKPEAIVENPFGRTDDKVRTNAPRGTGLLIKPAGPVDPEVAILSVETAAGEPLSLLANYGLHYVGGVPPFQLSADYFGEFARQIAGRLEAPPEFVGILSNGASGDVNNYNFLEPRPRAEPIERIRAVAERIAGVAADVEKELSYQNEISLGMSESFLELGVRKPDTADLAYAREKLAAAENPEKLNIPEVYAQETIRISEWPDTVTIKLQALRIGDDLGIVAIPCEVFAEIGLEIKKRSPFETTFVIALANGYNGYLPSPEQHEMGGYETWRSGWSFLEVNASRKISESVLEMLNKLKTEN